MIKRRRPIATGDEAIRELARVIRFAAQGEVKSNRLADDQVAPANTGLYASPQEATKALRADYEYWSGKTGDYGLALLLATIGAVWATHGATGTVGSILENPLAVGAIAAAVVSLGLMLLGAWLMSEAHLRRINYAEADSARWSAEFHENVTSDLWPYTIRIAKGGRFTRIIRVLGPATSAGLFFASLVVNVRVG